MAKHLRWQCPVSTLLVSASICALLASCGGGGGNNGGVTSPVSSDGASLPTLPGAPTLTGDTATDGYNWLNYRRAQLGLSVLTRNSLINAAAQAHSNYQRLNNTVTHVQTAGAPGYSGDTLLARLTNAGYVVTRPYALGEVISGTSSNSGFFQAEELITAVYHRFVMFEPIFKEAGTGAATTSGGYTYFTADLTAVNGYGPGLGAGKIVTYPTSNQADVQVNFFSDNESPDPVPTQNEVGYPISVHSDSGQAGIIVASFTVAPRGGNALATRLLSAATDAETPVTAAAIVPLAVLKSATTYDVSFSGMVAGVAVTRNWSFTTK